MKQNNKQELSYFRLKLRSYMSEHHPERLHDTEFITTRADIALTAYCDAVAQGFSHLEAESIASEVLYQGLHFSRYDTLVSVLENEFERELPAPLPEKLVPILLSNKAVQATFDKFGLTDTAVRLYAVPLYAHYPSGVAFPWQSCSWSPVHKSRSWR